MGAPVKPSRREHAEIIGLAEARLLPSRSRTRWNREIVWFQVDELNGLYDGLQLRTRRDARASIALAARTRIERVLTAARWKADAFIEGAWAFVRTEIEQPEDLFGPAVLLLGLAADDLKVRGWATALPEGVQSSLRLFGLGVEARPPGPAAAAP